MKILVAVKRVVDFTVQVRVKADETGIETTNVKMSMNPFDEIAVEEAVRLKEKNIAKEVVVVSIGAQSSQETLRTALAMGADRAILIETTKELEPLNVATILQSLVQKESFDLVILGKQAIDSDNNQTGQMLAGLLQWSQGTFVSSLKIENNVAIVTREIDGGLETLRLTLPSVITTDLRLNEPRYLSLPNIMQAKKKTIQVVPIQDLSSEFEPQLSILKVTGVPKRSAGIKVNSVQELIQKLRNEAQVLP